MERKQPGENNNNSNNNNNNKENLRNLWDYNKKPNIFVIRILGGFERVDLKKKYLNNG